MSQVNDYEGKDDEEVRDAQHAAMASADRLEQLDMPKTRDDILHIIELLGNLTDDIASEERANLRELTALAAMEARHKWAIEDANRVDRLARLEAEKITRQTIKRMNTLHRALVEKGAPAELDAMLAWIDRIVVTAKVDDNA
jgi:hypothetical protein